MSDFRPARRSALRALAGIGARARLHGVRPHRPRPVGHRRLGAEWESHARTFMSWPALASVWGEDLPYVRKDIARVARAIAAYEYVVMMARPDQVAAAQKACGRDVEVVPLAVDDLWARDTVPVFVEEGGEVVGVDFNFNGWGEKQVHDNDAQVGRKLLAQHRIPREQAPLVAEGGSFETDGEGTLLITESSIVNDNRNPDMSRAEIEAELKELLGPGCLSSLRTAGRVLRPARVAALDRGSALGHGRHMSARPRRRRQLRPRPHGRIRPVRRRGPG